MSMTQEDFDTLVDENKSLEAECKVLADKIDLYRQVILLLLEASEVHNV